MNHYLLTWGSRGRSPLVGMGSYAGVSALLEFTTSVVRVDSEAPRMKSQPRGSRRHTYRSGEARAKVGCSEPGARMMLQDRNPPVSRTCTGPVRYSTGTWQVRATGICI